MLNGNQPYLYGAHMCVADIAIFPFIRQYRGVNMEAFDNRRDLPHLQAWVHTFLEADAFKHVMEKKA